MIQLAPGANTTLGAPQCSWTLKCENSASLGEYAAIALLPLDERRKSQGKAALFQVSQDWMNWSGSQEQICCDLRLDQLPTGADRLLIVAYTFSAAGPISALQSIHLQVNGQIELHLNLSQNGESALVIGEFYCRNQEWKFRALAEGSAYGLSALGRRIGLDIDDSHPCRDSLSPQTSPRAGSTGTGFAVTSTHILTCAHIIEGCSEIHIASFEGKYPAEVVVVDQRNDLALLRVSEAPEFKPTTFREEKYCNLGESVVALGFPLAGLAGGGVHATQGGISALFGLHNDTRLLQFTAAIQPGSSGSPLFDSAGLVLGMVTSTVPDAQNMNFAVKASLALEFLSACDIKPPSSTPDKNISTAEVARKAQQSLWRIECV
ncbi:trypsin-like peptidase domain-containing protein [Microbulbifer sp. ZKSA006]|uniref:trypsin-like peptidase domain-containing protein n=1 Tax=Microbulbifer sp. ZKSA006 TaxID=3243390 RepID=UPI0040396146